MQSNINNDTSTSSREFVFRYPRYLLRRQMLEIIGVERRIDIYDPQELPIMCCLQKTFKLKDDITIYADDSKQVELLHIKARNYVDFSGAFDVYDCHRSQHVGVIRRKGLHSILRDSWEILDEQEILIGMLEEDNISLALVRRLLINLIPQSFKFYARDRSVVAEVRQRLTPFSHRMDIVMPVINKKEIDPRLILAGSLLLVLLEGKQD